MYICACTYERLYFYLYTCTYLHIILYIYILCIYRQGETERKGERETVCEREGETKRKRAVQRRRYGCERGNSTVPNRTPHPKPKFTQPLTH